MAGHAQLKFVMTECSKTQICLTRHIYNSFIISNFNYCPAVWHFCNAASTNKTEKIKERILRCINDGFTSSLKGERGGSVVECRTPEREVRGSRPTAAVLCP